MGSGKMSSYCSAVACPQLKQRRKSKQNATLTRLSIKDCVRFFCTNNMHIHQMIDPQQRKKKKEKKTLLIKIPFNFSFKHIV